MRGSGRYGAGGGTSPTPRSWPGSPSTARSRRSSNSDSTGPSIAGGRLATRSTTRSARRASTRSVTRSSSRTARPHLDASLLMIPLVGFLPADDPRMMGTVAAIAGAADGRRVRPALRLGRGRRRPAAGRGGVPALHLLAGRQPVPCRAAATRPARSSTGCWRSATTSACSPRNTTPSPAASSATSPRRSRTSAWSTRRGTSSTRREVRRSSGTRNLDAVA